jgi:hypothetical protein
VAIALHSMCQPGPAAAPRTFPPDVAILFVPRFPEREIAHVFLVVLVALHPPGGTQLGQIEVREMPVVRELIDPIVNRFVLCLIGQPARDQFLDHRDHSLDEALFRRRGIGLGLFDPQGIDVFEEACLNGAVNSRNGRFSVRLPRIVLSSTSVRFITRSTC